MAAGEAACGLGGEGREDLCCVPRTFLPDFLRPSLRDCGFHCGGPETVRDVLATVRYVERHPPFMLLSRGMISDRTEVHTVVEWTLQSTFIRGYQRRGDLSASNKSLVRRRQTYKRCNHPCCLEMAFGSAVQTCIALCVLLATVDGIVS